ncbi:TIGR01777 family oxidoreductase [Marinomonas sp. 2405UD68-3]|uniref:TIGR01777 family oxidoreductase n=1 Tax=Marinomonas sp. 2405UD68-3 TaxID=3391835 RepID=UPI0039C9B2FB
MKILITGGSGLIGSNLLSMLEGNEITVLTRNTTQSKAKLGDVHHYLSTLEALNNLDEFDVVINLAGEPIVAKRWSEDQKREIENSRWLVTEKLVQLIQSGKKPPHLFISGSAIGFYGKQDDHAIDEEFIAVHDEFSHRLCAKWESIAKQAESEKTRVCILRTGFVVSKKGGALSKMRLPFKMGLGGPISHGQQYISWIHIDDMLQGILHLIGNSGCHGVYNFTSPVPVTNNEFSREFAHSLNRPCLFRVPSFVIRSLMGEMSTLLLDGQRVVPKRLQESGYTFLHPELRGAFLSLIKP